MSEWKPSPQLTDSLAHGAAEILASTLLQAHREDRLWLYIWEQELLLALQAYRDQGGETPLHSWTMHFLHLNLAAIQDNGRMDYNLKADTERRLAAGDELAWR